MRPPRNMMLQCPSSTFFFFSNFIFGVYVFYLFNFWLLWVFVALRRLSLAAVNQSYSPSRCGLLIAVASLVDRWLSVPGLQELQQAASVVVPWHVESSWTRDQTHVPCIGRHIPIHSATRAVPSSTSDAGCCGIN